MSLGTPQELANLVREQVPSHRVVRQYDQDQGTQPSHEKPPVVLRTYAVAWGIPFDEVVFSKWVANVLMMRIMPWDHLITVQNTYLPRARSIVHDQFLNDIPESTEWLVMLDSDVAPPPDWIDRLVKHHRRDPRKKMLGGWYRKKADPHAPVLYHEQPIKDTSGELQTPRYNQFTEDEVAEGGIIRVDGSGAGCWLMHREVAEALGESPYDLHEGDGGEDLYICRKVRELGYNIYIDLSIACAHIGVGYV